MLSYSSHLLILINLVSITEAQQLLNGMELFQEPDVEPYSQTMGCIFGGATYDFDSKWHPVLEPYGIMYCLECSCNAIIKKSLLQQRGQVLCRKISQDCPDVSHCADTAILPPNSCCKICPEHLERSGRRFVSSGGRRHSRLDHQSASNSEKQTAEEYQVLLAPVVGSDTEAIGRAHLIFDKASLQITMEFSRSLELASLQFVGKDGTVLYDASLGDSESRKEQSFTLPGFMDENSEFNVTSNTEKYCHSWSAAFKYVEEFKSGSIKMRLTSADNSDVLLEGAAITLSTIREIKQSFSALLIGDNQSGKTGAMSMSIDMRDNSLIFNGHVTSSQPQRKGKESIVIEFMRDSRVQHRAEGIITNSPKRGGEFEGKWDSLPSSNLKQLARGRLSVRLTFADSTRIAGEILTWHQCAAYNALVTGADAMPPTSQSGVGLGNFHLKPNGRLQYRIQLQRMDSKVLGIYIEADRTGRRGQEYHRVTRLTRNYDRNTGLAVGVYDKMDAVEIQLFAEGQLFINVETREHPQSAIRGQIVQMPYSTHEDHTLDATDSTKADEPILMYDDESGVAGAAWCDSLECTLTCHILVPRVSVRRDRTTRAYLDYWETKHLLATFSSTNVMEVTLSQVDVHEISSSSATLRITTLDALLFGQVRVPRQCFEGIPPSSAQGDQPIATTNNWVDQRIPEARKCSYDGKIYDDGDSWKPVDDTLQCVTCSCLRDKVQCHPVVCPTVECENPVLLPGECCPACPKPDEDTSKQCFFPGDHRQHALGTVWHPYMYPNGYSLCAVCFCKPDASGYDCKPTQCPVLDCDTRLATTKLGDCCPSCPEPDVLEPAQPIDTNRMVGDSNSYSSCKVANTIYSNGETFNPEIGPYGVYGNVVCKCKDGMVECHKIECDCNKRSSRRNRCCMEECGYSSSDLLLRGKKRQKGKRKEVFC